MREKFDKLSYVNKTIAEFLIKYPKSVVGLSGKELSKKLGVSQASVSRFCHLFDYAGINELRICLSQQIVEYSESVFHELDSDDFKNDIAYNLLQQNIVSLQETYAMLQNNNILKAAKMIHNSNKILCAGIGVSDLVAQDMMQKLLRIQKNVYLFNDMDLRKVVLSQFQENDLLFVVSYSGEKKETLDLVRIAKNQGIKTIALTGNSNNTLSKLVDIVFKAVAFEGEYRTGAVSSRISHLYLVDVIFYTYSLFFQEASTERFRRTYDLINSHKRGRNL